MSSHDKEKSSIFNLIKQLQILIFDFKDVLD